MKRIIIFIKKILLQGNKNKVIRSRPPDNKYRILILDDEIAEISSLQFKLRNRFEIDGAITERDLWKQLAKRRYDILLLDLRLNRKIPKEPIGIELLAHLREVYPNLKIIIYSNDKMIQSILRSFSKGAIDYIIKDKDDPLENKLLEIAERKNEQLDKSIPLKIFIAHDKDEDEAIDKLVNHLSSLNGKFLIGEVWNKKEILGGEPIIVKIEEKLKASDFCIMLLSPSMLASRLLYPIVEAYAKEGKKHFFIIIVKRAFIEETIWERMQLLPRRKDKYFSGTEDEIWSEIIIEINRFIEKNFPNAHRQRFLRQNQICENCPLYNSHSGT